MVAIELDKDVRICLHKSQVDEGTPADPCLQRLNLRLRDHIVKEGVSIADDAGKLWSIENIPIVTLKAVSGWSITAPPFVLPFLFLLVVGCILGPLTFLFPLRVGFILNPLSLLFLLRVGFILGPLSLPFLLRVGFILGPLSFLFPLWVGCILDPLSVLFPLWVGCIINSLPLPLLLWVVSILKEERLMNN